MITPAILDCESPRGMTLRKFISYSFAVICMIFMARATGGFLSGNDARDLSDDGGGESPAFAAACLVFYVITGLWLLAHSNYLRRILSQQKLLLMFLFLCLMSTAWSILPSGTLVRAISLVGNCCIAFYLYYSFSKQELLRIFCAAFIVMGIGSVLIAVINPSIGIMQGGDNSGNWRGLFIHKNPASYVFVIAAIFAWWGVNNDRAWRGAWLSLLLLSALLIVLTQSRTGFVALFFCAIFGCWLRFKSASKHSNKILADISIMFAIAAGYWLFTNADIFLNVLGRDATLTGRTKIWSIAFDYLLDRPFLGYGYQASWRAPEAMPLQMVLAGWLYNPSQSHNSFIDIALGVGLVGGAVVCVWLARIMLLTMTRRILLADPLMRAFSLVNLSIIITGMSGRTVMQTNSIGTTLLVISSLYVADCLRNGKNGPVSPEI